MAFPPDDFDYYWQSGMDVNGKGVIFKKNRL
jgi:hypothetical protein